MLNTDTAWFFHFIQVCRLHHSENDRLSTWMYCPATGAESITGSVHVPERIASDEKVYFANQL